MLLDKEVEIKMNSKHISKYKSLGYDCKVNEKVLIKIEHLSLYSKCEVNVSCDVCGKHNKINYTNYNKLIKKNGLYRCFECGKEKAKLTMIDKYGVDNPTKSNEIVKKIQEKYKEKSEEEKKQMVKKQKETMFNKYGSWFTKTELYKEKILKSSLEKYGVEDYRSSEQFKSRVKKTLSERYGVDHVSHISIKKIKNKKALFGKKINGFHEKSELSYQGTYELDFLEKYHDKVNIEKIDPIKYKLNENTHYYHPDFYLPEFNLIIEIKSSYTYEYDLEKNLSKKEYSIRNGYNFLFIKDKDYSEFEKYFI